MKSKNNIVSKHKPTQLKRFGKSLYNGFLLIILLIGKTCEALTAFISIFGLPQQDKGDEQLWQKIR